MNKIIIVLVFLLSISNINATEINIYYPNNNTTTDIYYATNLSYNHTIANNVSGNLSMVILNNEKEYDNIIESPHKIISPLFKLLFIVVFFSMVIFLIYKFKRSIL